MIQRKDNWPDLLSAAITERLHMPFAWGENDCVMCAASIIERFTGVDLAASWRGKYKTAIGAARIFKKEGGLLAMVERVLAEHSITRIPPRLAQRGSLAMLMQDSGPTLAVVDGARLMAPGERGLVPVAIPAVEITWRVG